MMDQTLIPGIVTNLEVDRLAGSTRNRQRWEEKGLLPQGHWVRGRRKVIGLYPQAILANLMVVKKLVRSQEGFLERVSAREDRFASSSAFGALQGALRGFLRTQSPLGLRYELLDYLAERDLLLPLQEESADLVAQLNEEGISFTTYLGEVVRVGEEGVVIVVVGDGEVRLPEETFLSPIVVGRPVMVERVRVDSLAQDFVMASGPALSHHLSPAGDESGLDELFAGFDYTPLAVPKLSERTEEMGLGGDLIRPRRRVRVDLSAELYADSNPMVRKSRPVRT